MPDVSFFVWDRQSNSPISNRDYPLTWEIQASEADYEGMAISMYKKKSSPHTWHATEIFLYLTGKNMPYNE